MLQHAYHLADKLHIGVGRLDSPFATLSPNAD